MHYSQGMADLPTPGERRTAKVVIYVTPGDRMTLTSLAQWVGMSVSEMGAQALTNLIDLYEQTGTNREESVPQGGKDPGPAGC